MHNKFIPDICHFFLHEQNFWRIKFTPKKRVNYDKIHSKVPIFCVITAKYTVNCQIFALNLKNLHRPKIIYTNIFVGFVTNMRYGSSCSSSASSVSIFGFFFLELRIFWKEQLAEQFCYFNFSLYRVVFLTVPP